MIMLPLIHINIADFLYSNYKDYSQDEISIYLNVIDYLKETRNEKELIALSKHNLALTDKLISNTIENRLNEML